MNFSIIVALDQKRGIGINNKLPWNIKADLKHFSDITINPSNDKQNVVIMGRKTWESLPQSRQPLPQRLNIVLSKQTDLSLPPNVLLYSSLNRALIALEERKKEIKEIFIIGGGKLYAETIYHPQCSKIYITQILQTFPCDTFFPEIPKNFKKIEESEIQEENKIKFRFIVYEKSN
ncbi:dihydrofolate reductase [Patescibacteria group bacterium]|nr:dihydrofolate reductase [Patescibacteria group bacterium]